MKSIISKISQTLRNSIILAGCFALLSLLRDSFLLWGFSFGYFSDSAQYARAGRSLLNPAFPYDPFDIMLSVPYPVLNGLSGAADHPLVLAWVQILLGALAVGSLVYVLSRKSYLLAGLTGLLLLMDLTWASYNRSLLSEGVVMSFLILSLALLIDHYERHASLHGGELFAAGMLYAWALSIRPGYVFLIPLTILAYGWLTRSWRKTAWISGGIALLLLASASLNLWRTGGFRLFGQSGGGYLDPFSESDLYSPQNGPASRQLYDLGQNCGIDLSSIKDKSYRQKIPGCAISQGIGDIALSDLYQAAYQEGVVSHPFYMAGIVLRRATVMLSYDLVWHAGYNLNKEGLACRPDFALCPEIPPRRIPPDNLFTKAWMGAEFVVSQVYLLPRRIFLGTAGTDDFSTDVLVVSVLFALLNAVYLLAATRSSERFMTLGCLILIGYVVFSVSASRPPTSRYTAPLSPIYAVLTALTINSIGKQLWKRKMTGG